MVVEAGARVHFHANSGLIVADDASLEVNGGESTTELLENEVVFEGDRLEPNYSDVPGQWGTVWFLPGSNGNNLKNLTIKNATVGMLVTKNDGTPTPTIDMMNVQIYNCANVGILARTGNMVGRNVVINNCGQASLACTEGGSYDFTHCTFANYWSSPNQTCLVLNDYYETSTSIVAVNLTKANFRNCIFYGSSNISIDLEKKGATFEYQFNNCLIKFVDFNNQFINGELYSFSSNPNYTNCFIASTSLINKPDFIDEDKNILKIGENSIARNNANLTFSTFADILGNSRATFSDIGAYEYLP